MAKNKVKSYYTVQDVIADVDGKTRKVLVYAEVNERKYAYGYAPVMFTVKGRVPVDIGNPILLDSTNVKRSPVKEFNMGFAICMENDEFNLGRGISIAKQRFNKRPMSTQNGRWLNEDMVMSIIENEARYICDHIEKFISEAQVKRRGE